MSTYYEYADVKRMIVNELFKRNGWKVWGYYPDNSDPMTDYYDPEHWGGIAEKNGYVLVVDKKWAEKAQEVYECTASGNTEISDMLKKIEKLKAMTVDRGASEQEEATARASIEKLMARKTETEENSRKKTPVGVIPAHMANPSRCNWHIEKDGVIIAKGTGLLKFAKVYQYFKYDYDKDEMMEFKRNRENYLEMLKERMRHDWRHQNDTEEEISRDAQWKYDKLSRDEKLYDAFNQLIGKFDTTAGGLMGNAEYEYKKEKVTEYRTERKAVECPGEIKEGQEIILKTNFNYGCRKGYVYRIHEASWSRNGEEKFFHAVRLNGKLTKELTGTANKSNSMFFMSKPESIQRWIDQGAIAFCKIVEEKVPYEVEKVVKVSVKNEKTEETKPDTTGKFSGDYDVKEDTDTRDGSRIWVVKVLKSLEREEFSRERARMKEAGGYYSRFKHGFIFREDPTEILSEAV